MWQQSPYMADSGIHSATTTQAPSLSGEQHLHSTATQAWWPGWLLQPLTQTSHWPAPTATGAPLSGEQQLQSSPPLKQHLVTFAPCQVSSIYSPHQQHLVTGAPLSGKQHLQSSPAAPTVTGAPLSGEQLYSPRQQHIQSQALPCQVSSTYSHRHLHMKFSITLPVSLNFAIMQWDTCFSPWFSNVF